MRKDLVYQLNQWIRKEGERITPLLPPHEHHPGGRNGIAHLFHIIQSIMHRPMKECRSRRYDDIVEIVQFAVDNVDEKHIVRQIKHLYEPEPEDEPSTLDGVFDDWSDDI